MANGIIVPKRLTLFDDGTGDDARSLMPARATTVKDMAEALNHVACRPRPIYSFWGDANTVNSSVIGVLWPNLSPACPGLGSRLIVVPTFTASPVSTQSLAWGIDAGVSDGNADSTGNAAFPVMNDQVTGSGTSYPKSSVEFGVFPNHESYQDNKLYRVGIDSATLSGPKVKSGLIFEKRNLDPKIRHFKDGDGVLTGTHMQALPTDCYSPGSPIIGPTFGLNDFRSLEKMREFFRSVYKSKRLVFGWSAVNPGGFYVAFSVSSAAYRYIFDQSVGVSGVAPSTTGPGISVPLQYSASGLRTTQRIYVAVYAAMSAGGGDEGGLAVYNRANDGSMAGPTALTNGPTITGTSFAWYPGAGDFDEDTAPYFQGNALLNFSCDRVLLCAKRTSGSTAHVRIGAVMMWAYHAT
jgi:hypothetical protein